MNQIIASMQSWLATRGNDDKGATMVEYALMVALVAIALITVIGTMTDSLDSTFDLISNTLDTVVTEATPD